MVVCRDQDASVFFRVLSYSGRERNVRKRPGEGLWKTGPTHANIYTTKVYTGTVEHR